MIPGDSPSWVSRVAFPRVPPQCKITHRYAVHVVDLLEAFDSSFTPSVSIATTKESNAFAISAGQNPSITGSYVFCVCSLHRTEISSPICAAAS